MLIRLCLLILLLTLVIGCKASPAKHAGFIVNSETLADTRETTPFHRGWISEQWYNARHTYDRIYIAPINTDYLIASDWWQRQNARSQEGLEDGLVKVSQYMHEKIIEAFLEDPDRRYAVVTEPGPGVLTLEIALVELTPAKIYLNAAGNISAFFIPLTRLVSSATGKGTIAFEGRLKNSESKVYVRMADREKDKSAPINIASFAWHQGSKQNIKDWSEQIVAVLKADEGERVKDSWAFTFKPW